LGNPDDKDIDNAERYHQVHKAQYEDSDDDHKVNDFGEIKIPIESHTDQKNHEMHYQDDVNDQTASKIDITQDEMIVNQHDSTSRITPVVEYKNQSNFSKSDLVDKLDNNQVYK